MKYIMSGWKCISCLLASLCVCVIVCMNVWVKLNAAMLETSPLDQHVRSLKDYIDILGNTLICSLVWTLDEHFETKLVAILFGKSVQQPTKCKRGFFLGPKLILSLVTAQESSTQTNPFKMASCCFDTWVMSD